MRKTVSNATAKKTRRSGKADAARTPSDKAAFGIIDAVVDQNSAYWIRYGSSDRAAWFSASDIVARPATVFDRLAKAGVILATTRSQSRVKEDVEAQTEYRPGLVADRPGWVATSYIMGDGTVIRAPGDDTEVIVAFETDPKFTPGGDLAAWQHAIRPFLPGQPLVRFALAVSLAGPLLRFVPKDFDNPIVEYVGPPERGKSTVMTLAASVWAGEPESKTGGADSWSLTVNATDLLRSMRADNLLALDEGGEMPGDTPREKKDNSEKLIFKFSSTGHKRRMGDSAVSPHTRGVLLSNTNLPLAANVSNTARDTRDALLSRIVTVAIGEERPFGIFSKVPDGFKSSEAASRALRQAVEIGYGAAGRAFVARVAAAINDDQITFEKMLAKKLAEEESYLDDFALPSRIRKTLALMSVAGLLGQRYGVIPKSWGSIRYAVRIVASRAAADRPLAAQPSALDRVRTYLKENEAAIIDAATLSTPLDHAVFERAAGFRYAGRNGRIEVMIPTPRFSREMPKHVDVMRALRNSGHARGENGKQSKLSIKAPPAICRTGRVYCILV